MVQAYDTLSYFQFMILTHESHQRNFGSHDLEVQDEYLVKLQ